MWSKWRWVRTTAVISPVDKLRVANCLSISWSRVTENLNWEPTNQPERRPAVLNHAGWEASARSGVDDEGTFGVLDNHYPDG